MTQHDGFDPVAEASLFRGLADVAEGTVRPLGWVTADDEDADADQITIVTIGPHP